MIRNAESTFVLNRMQSETIDNDISNADCWFIFFSVFFLAICCLFSEVYADHPEKRRKRGSSLFFRKKKDKSKTKGQSTNCDGMNYCEWIEQNSRAKFFLEWYAINYLFFRLWCCYKSSNVQRSCSRVQSKNCKGKFWCPDKHFSFNSIFHDEFPEICRVNRTIKALERRIQPAGNFSYSFLSQQ